MNTFEGEGEFEIKTDCIFCANDPSDNPTPVMNGTFRSGEDGYLCKEHFARAQAFNQLTAIRLPATAERIQREEAERFLLELDLLE